MKMRIWRNGSKGVGLLMEMDLEDRGWVDERVVLLLLGGSRGRRRMNR